MRSKIKKFLIVILFLTALVLLFTRLFSKQEESKSVCFGDTCYAVEIADNDQARELGLMDRESLNKDKGMLFVFDNEGDYPFWMKDTKIPLDIVWMDRDWNVVAIKTALPCNADPCPNYDPGTRAKFVLEMIAGQAEKNNIKVGDEAKLR